MTGKIVDLRIGQRTAMPRIACPKCRKRMRWAGWVTKVGGRYLCKCGYKFWVTAVKDHTAALLPEFRGPKQRRRRVPPEYLPPDVKRRLNVMRQWKKQRETGLRSKHDPAPRSRRYGAVLDHPARVAHLNIGA